MGKLCAKGKAAAKRKFKVYPSAYANMYASACVFWKSNTGGKKKPKKKANGGMINKISQQRKKVSNYNQGGIAKGCGGIMENKRKITKTVMQRKALRTVGKREVGRYRCSEKEW